MRMPKVLDIIERKPGERCCGSDSRPQTTYRAAERDAADFELLSHPVRLQLLDVLARSGGRVCVCDLEAAVPVKQPTVSHHLRLLREAGLVESEKIGVWAYYHVHEARWRALQQRIEARLGAMAPGGEHEK